MPTPRQTILVIEDEHIARQVLARLYLKHGYIVVEALPDLDMLSTMLLSPPDAVVVEHTVPST